MKFKLISCEVLFREMCAASASSPHQIDLEFLPKGLHDLPTELMLERIQAVIDQADEQSYDAILLGYGLCNNGLVGIRAKTTQLILPRGHDCMTLFFGSRQRYQTYFDANPGTFFRTSGWLERDELEGELKQLSIGHACGMDMSYEQLVAEYGEDNAEYLYETLCNTAKNYSQLTYINMGIEPAEFAERARHEAQNRDFSFENVDGDMSLITCLLHGEWDSADFLNISPGQTIQPSYDDAIVKMGD